VSMAIRRRYMNQRVNVPCNPTGLLTDVGAKLNNAGTYLTLDMSSCRSTQCPCLMITFSLKFNMLFATFFTLDAV
jgi:hypothetical protein